MKMNNPQHRVPFFQVPDLADESFRLLELRGGSSGCSWHFHPEYQIGYVIEGRGKRVVGDSVCAIRPGELILLGANLPHVWRYDDKGENGHATRGVVIHFSDGFLGREFFHKPEMRDVRLLLARSALGLQAQGETRERASEIIRTMSERDGFQRVLDLLSLLHLLAGSRELKTLCSEGFHPLTAELEIERLRRVCDYVQANFAGSVNRDEVAGVAHLSPSAFSRFFKTHTGRTFQEYVNEVRIGNACRMLMEPSLNVTEIAGRCGFADVSTFNRSFRRVKEMSPTEYRQRLGDVTGT